MDKTSKQNFRIFLFLQTILIILLIIFMIAVVHYRDNQEASFGDIQNFIITQPTVAELLPRTILEAGNEISFDASQVDEGLYYSANDIMNVNELLIIRIKDDTVRERTMEAVNKYLEDKKNTFEGYGTDQFGLLNNAILMEKGEYLFYGVSPDVLTWESTFESCFR